MAEISCQDVINDTQNGNEYFYDTVVCHTS